MITKKIILIFTVLILFIFSSSCKNEAVKQESTSTTESQVEKIGTATLERLDSDAYASRMDTVKVQLVDIRTFQEFKDGHIENAENVNVLDSTFMDQIASQYSKYLPVHVYCTAGGKRSIDAAKMLQEGGYNVVNLDGGIVEWEKKGYNVVIE